MMNRMKVEPPMEEIRPKSPRASRRIRAGIDLMLSEISYLHISSGPLCTCAMAQIGHFKKD